MSERKPSFWQQVKAGVAEQQAKQAAKEAARRVAVVRYKSRKEFERDAEKRIAEGWTIQGQSQETGQAHRISRGVNGALLGGFVMMPGLGALIGALDGKRSQGPITVTWVRPPASPSP